jgi:hypothetical protein
MSFFFIPIHRYVESIFLFVFIFIIACIIFPHFGSFYDEPIERLRGLITYKYLISLLNNFGIELDFPSALGDYALLPDLRFYQDGDHGPFFDLIAVGIEILFGITDIKLVYLSRHFLVFFIFFLGLIALYQITLRWLKDTRYACLCVMIMVLSPRIFADSFYNSKDLVFLSLFLLATNSCIKFILRPSLLTAFFFGFTSAIATDVRLMGVLVPLATLCIAGLSAIRSRASASQILKHLPWFAFCYCFFIFVFWPWLWHDPLGQIQNAFASMAKFPNQPPTQYLGKTIISNGVPWHYIPVWIFLTTPVPYTIFFLVGLFVLVKRNICERIAFIGRNASESSIQDLLFLGLFFGPITIIITLKSILYDGWRHVFFVYPFFVIIGTLGIKFLMDYASNYFKLRLLLSSVLVATGIHMCVWMTKAHPYQNVYFNFLAGKGLANKFDLDYWGISLRECLEYIAGSTKTDEINIFASGILNLSAGLDMLSATSRKRFHVVSSVAQADFLITNFRDDLKSYTVVPTGFRLYRQIIVDGEVIAAIFKSDKPHAVLN